MSSVSPSSSASQGSAGGLEVVFNPCNAEFVSTLEIMRDAGASVNQLMEYTKMHYAAYHATLRRSSGVGSEVSSEQSSPVPSPRTKIRKSQPWRTAKSWRSSIGSASSAVSAASSVSSVVKEDGFCYLSIFSEDSRRKLSRQLGEWPSLEKLMSVKSQFVDHSLIGELCFTGTSAAVHVESSRDAIGDSVSAVFSKLASQLEVGSDAIAPGSCGEHFLNAGGELSRSWWPGIIVGGNLELVNRFSEHNCEILRDLHDRRGMSALIDVIDRQWGCGMFKLSREEYHRSSEAFEGMWAVTPYGSTVIFSPLRLAIRDAPIVSVIGFPRVSTYREHRPYC